MEIALGFDQLLQALTPTMTVPTFHSLVTILTGWGHSWVVLGVIIELPPRQGHYFCLPILGVPLVRLENVRIVFRQTSHSQTAKCASNRFCNGPTRIRLSENTTTTGKYSRPGNVNVQKSN